MDTKIKQVDILPLIKHYMEELQLARLFDKYLPNRNGMQSDPAQVLCLTVMNIMVSAKPLYRVEDRLHDYFDGVTEKRFEAEKYNDDRLGRTLDLLFAADRSSLLTELSVQAIGVHEVETEAIHNDSTSVTLIGAYDEEDRPWLQQGPSPGLQAAGVRVEPHRRRPRATRLSIVRRKPGRCDHSYPQLAGVAGAAGQGGFSLCGRQ